MSNQESIRTRRIVAGALIGLTAIVVAVSIAAPFFAARQSGAFYSYYYYPYHHPFFFPFHFGWFGGIGILLPILVILLIAGWLLWPSRRYQSEDLRQHSDNAASILRERYAKGEITREQFESMMRDLKQAS
ncbi:SHOCT domain-containing protein [Candidatus Nitrososphaera evergladensis]|nr:SHOCT domain-containing protein [Candidatus Nitrososphaera evergladensis]